MEKRSRVIVLANPLFVADVLSRALLLAGWEAGAAVESMLELGTRISVEENDVIVVVESAELSAPSVLTRLRSLYPSVYLMALSDSARSIDARSIVLPLNCGVRDVISTIPRLVGVPVRPNQYGLTARQVEVLQHMARSCTAEQTGKALGLSTKTVNNYLTEAYRRLGAINLTQAVVRAARASLIDIDAS